jgi:uncharacterized protein with HEPN domain
MVEAPADRDTALLLDMLLAARDARAFIAGLNEAAFVASRLHQNAVIRSLAIIGEAAGKVSPAFRAAQPAIPWREIIGMRHRLIHGYGEVRLDLVWQVVDRRLGLLIAAVEPLVPDEGARAARGRFEPGVQPRQTTGAHSESQRAFARTIGVDYSGAQTPTDSLPGLRIYMSEGDAPPQEALPPPSPRKYWTRREVAEWLVERLAEDVPTLVGIDHGFSFPLQYFQAHGLALDWPAFLDDFQRHWPTDDDIYVCFVREGVCGNETARRGNPRWRRLTEVRAGGAKSVFHFDVPGQVATSTHAGLPWLRFIRARLGARAHFWPFDGWDIPAGRSAIAEVYPALWSRGFAREGRTRDQHDAYCVAAWLARADRDGALAAFLNPGLSLSERAQAQTEGWILGVPGSNWN